jgi:hypothetical protein
MKRLGLSLLGVLIFLAGILLEISISGGVLWGEFEARIYTAQVGDAGLTMECPLMLSPSESGTVRATITNPLDEEADPVVTAWISRTGGNQQLSQTLTLAPHETQTLQWTIDRSDMIFGRLILVNVLQSRFSDSISRQGACGVLVLSLLALDGIRSFSLFFSTALLCTLLGSALWLRVNWPLNELHRSTARACGILAGMATAGMLVALTRGWGLILLLDFLTLIILAVVLTEFVLFPRRR